MRVVTVALVRLRETHHPKTWPHRYSALSPEAEDRISLRGDTTMRAEVLVQDFFMPRDPAAINMIFTTLGKLVPTYHRLGNFHHH